MAKPDVLETSTATETASPTSATAELKRELEIVVRSIVEKDDYSVESTDRAMQTLRALKELKFKRSLSFGSALGDLCLPDQFRCPISRELMKDPVILATGQTYDRPFIQKWLKDGNRTCPQTQLVLSHTVLTPNHLVRKMISEWCKDCGIELPNPIQDNDDKIIKDADRDHLYSMLEKLSSSLSDQKEAAKELRLLTKRVPSFRALFGECTDAIPQLLNPLSPGRVANTDPDLQEDLVTTVLNISIHDNNKQPIAENPLVIPLLIESLKFGTIETRSNAAAALFTLSAFDSNKHIIGKSGALKPLIKLLDEGHPLAIKDAASAIFNLCIVLENKGRAVGEGAVGVILKKIVDRTLLDELLAILAMLSCHQKAVEEMGELGAVPCLLSILREKTSDRNKENCVAVLYTICFSDRTKLRVIEEEENANGTLSMLAEMGTSRAKRKANGILERLNRLAVTVTHCLIK